MGLGVVFSMSDVPLGFGIAAKFTHKIAETWTRMILWHYTKLILESICAWRMSFRNALIM